MSNKDIVILIAILLFSIAISTYIHHKANQIRLERQSIKTGSMFEVKNRFDRLAPSYKAVQEEIKREREYP